MRRIKLPTFLIAPVVAAAAVAVVALGTWPATTSQASEPCDGSYSSAGCTSYPDYEPVFESCSFSPGSSCYKCEYTCDGGGYERCGESPDGSIQLCGKFEPFHDY